MGKKNESESETNGLALETDRRPRPVRSWVAVSRDWLGQRRVIAPSRRLMRCFAFFHSVLSSARHPRGFLLHRGTNRNCATQPVCSSESYCQPYGQGLA